MGVQDLGTWLDSIGLGECQPLLAAHHIDREALRGLTDLDLAQVGLSIGQRRKLLRAASAIEPVHDAPPKLATRAERRQMTVMFCDLAGSTALAARLDPEDLRHVIGIYLREIGVAVSRFGGYVARYMGDGALVYFGWPQAHEDAAEQAARAGLAVVEAVRKAAVEGSTLGVRVGIATGLVIVGDLIGSASAREHVVVGEAPNLAARLQSAAAPNTVVIAAPTRRLLGRMFDLAPVGPYVLKGVEGAVPAWRVLREHEGDSRFMALRLAARGSMVNRDAELALLGALWQRTRRGAGQVLLLTGEAGIGKTRIVEAFGEALASEPHLRFRYQCVPHHASTALHPLIRGLRKATGIAHADPEEVKLEKLRQLLRDTGPDTGPGSAETLANFAALLSLGGAPAPLQDGGPQQRKARMLAGLVEYCAMLSRQRPMLLQFEDAHWSDPTTLELCGLAVERAASLPLMIIASGRPEFEPGWRAAHITRRTVSRLGRDHSAEMIRRIVGSKRLPAAVSDHILSKTDGVPLFTEELTLALFESGAVSEGSEAWDLAGVMAPLTIPATLQDSLTARLDRLGWVKTVAQTAAVIGRDFSPQLLALATGLSPAQLHEALQRLCDTQLVVEQGSVPSQTYKFRHALIQDAAYAGLLLSERRTLHAVIAGILEAELPEVAGSQPELLGHHFAEARQPEQAVDWWRRAGKRSAQAMAYAEAIDQFNRCLGQLELLPQTAERDHLEAAIRIELGLPLIGVGGYTSAAVKANIERVAELHGRTAGITPFPTLAAQVALAFSSSDIVRAVALANQFLEAATQAGDRQLRVMGHWLIGMTLTGAAQLPAARFHLEASLQLNDAALDAGLAEVYGIDPRVAALAYHALVLQQIGHPGLAAASDAASMAHAVQCGHPATRVYALTLRVCFHLLRFDHAALAVAAAELRGMAQRQGSPIFEALSAAVLGLLQAMATPDDQVFAGVRQIIDSIRRAGWNLLMGWLGLFEARVCLQHGRTLAARQTLDTLQDVLEPRGHDLFLPELFRLRAALSRLEGMDPAVAEGLLARSMALAGAQEARLAQLRSGRDLALLLRGRDGHDAAHRLLAPLRGWFAEGTGASDLDDWHAQENLDASTNRSAPVV